MVFVAEVDFLATRRTNDHLQSAVIIELDQMTGLAYFFLFFSVQTLAFGIHHLGCDRLRQKPDTGRGRTADFLAWPL